MRAAPTIRADAPEPRRSFLGVDKSLLGRRWVDRLASDREATAASLAQRQELPDILARVLAARGATADDVAQFLDPAIKTLMPDPALLRDMTEAAERIADAIVNGEPIAIFGDYDVDGAASAALLHRFLAAHGSEARIYIPDRLLEGYGPGPDAFERLVAEGARLIVTVDCGTMAHEAIARARALGVDVVVADHHLARESIPEAVALVNPNRLDDLSGMGSLAAAGVVFLMLVAVTRALRKRQRYAPGQEPDLLQWLDLVALATVCDVVPLRGLNRAFVVKGLKVIGHRMNCGLNALADAASLAGPVECHHLGFVFGPRINAGGRIGDSGLGARLLSTEDADEATAIAAQLEQLNGERKATEKVILEEAAAQAERLLDTEPDAPFLLLAGEDWHKGVLGLVASRLTEAHRLPSVVIGWDQTGLGVGSARSIAGVDIGSAISQALDSGHLVKGGGHAMAAGLTIARVALADFSEFMRERLRPQVAGAAERDVLAIDGAVMASGATVRLLKELERAGPFGSGNPQPRVAIAAHRVSYAKVVGTDHVRCTLAGSDGGKLNAVAFRAAESQLGRALLERSGQALHVAGHLRRDRWQGRERIELVIEDAAIPARR
ncbi:MAG: single-stranded-DNA-specific exonuclease RecJ [Pseudomonadota bacterium]|nr:single-stranded-DNA-specific exonuclease RecJ [Pseudomonadota bacterium]